MDKVLIDLFVPAIGMHFDVFIPEFMQIKTICELLGKAVVELSEEQYVSSEQEVLCSVEMQLVLDCEKTLEDYNVQNGDTLMLC